MPPKTSRVAREHKQHQRKHGPAQQKPKRMTKKQIEFEGYKKRAHEAVPTRTFVAEARPHGYKFELVPASADIRGYGEEIPNLDRARKDCTVTSDTQWTFVELQFCRTRGIYHVYSGNRRIKVLRDEGHKWIPAWVKEYKNLG